jgi:hypothetical protein
MLLHQFWRDMGDYVDACEGQAHHGQYGQHWHGSQYPGR